MVFLLIGRNTKRAPPSGLRMSPSNDFSLLCSNFCRIVDDQTGESKAMILTSLSAKYCIFLITKYTKL